MQITLSDSFDVYVDGTLYGALADTVANNPKLASDIQRAIPVKLAERDAKWNEAIKSADDRGNSIQADFDAYKKSAEEFRATLIANRDDHPALQTTVDELAKPEKDRQREALLSARAELDAQLAAL